MNSVDAPILEFKETVSGALWYDPWLNRLEACGILKGGSPGSGVNLSLAPHEMQILAVPSVRSEMPDITPVPALTHEENLTDSKWEIALKRAEENAWETTPWQGLQNITGPDGIPAFSCTIRYRTALSYDGGPYARLDLGDVYETAEVFVNGQKAGARVAPPCLLDVGHLLRRGDNTLEILVTNTLVHSQRDHFSMTLPIEPSGLLGPVRLLYTPE